MTKERVKFCWCRRIRFARHRRDAVRSFGWVVPDPPPTHCLGERRAQHDMDPFDRPRRQRLTGDTAVRSQRHVQRVDVRSSQIANHDCAEVWKELTIEHRTGLSHRSWRPPGRGDRVPAFEQLADGGSRAEGRAATGNVNHRCQFSFGFGTVAAHGFGSVAATPGRRVGAGEDTQFP